MSSALHMRRNILDRLLTADDIPDGLVMTCSLEQLRDTVARDLEHLLNARAPFDFEGLAGLPCARESILTFGVRDFVGRVLSNTEEQRFIGRSLSQAIAAHEPRLSDVRVDFAVDRGATNSLAFTIRALLLVHPNREHVSFDAVLQPSVSRFQVLQARFAPAA